MRCKVNACGSAGQWEEALHLIANFCKEHYQPEAIFLGDAIAKAPMALNRISSTRILNTLQRDAGKYVCKSTTGWFRLGGRNELDIVKSCQAVTFTAAIDACGVASQWQRGLVLLSKLGKDLSVGNLHEFAVDCVDLRTVLECFAVVIVDDLPFTGGCNCLQHGHQRLWRRCRVAERPDAFAGCEVCRHAKLLGKTSCNIRK